jgi:hypothetical protein
VSEMNRSRVLAYLVPRAPVPLSAMTC